MSTERSTPMIEVKDLRKWFPIHAGVLSRRVGEVKADRRRVWLRQDHRWARAAAPHRADGWQRPLPLDP